ncbi:uncharacterized protein J8A68_004830 [[Candida] subhashii]|uniref:Kinetochore-associated protein MTW1 n=1 Tax=[Candida] subhashii TaxID=561895 RepID=A0A8J5QEU9_9ASCO|nr:uncharacterized protein J8A68_004830 [[Candida] subhashii]KAG7661677.1 hypothetical protein J8A68_004830 [[Candida] subhashii]
MSNESLDARTIAILTEHFGYSPVTIINDVINAVNQIMYRGTKAFERYLFSRKQAALEKQRQEDDSGKNPQRVNVFREVSDDDIRLGTAKLEKLLESQVDLNFDKFELYTLRNIFNIPRELVDGGWVRLKHHEGVEFGSEIASRKPELHSQLVELKEQIEFEAHIQTALKLQLIKATKIVETMRLLKSNLRFLATTKLPDDNEEVIIAKEKLASLSPIDETLHYLIKQVKILNIEMENVSKRITYNLHHKKFLPDERDIIQDGRVIQILTKVGIRDYSSKNQSTTSHDPKVILQDSQLDFPMDFNQVSNSDAVRRILEEMELSQEVSRN